MLFSGPQQDVDIPFWDRLTSALTLSDHESVVRPTERIVDFRTEHSGIRPADIINGTLMDGTAPIRVLLECACSTTLASSAAPTLEEIQPKAKELMQGRILVGHHISHDLRVGDQGRGWQMRMSCVIKVEQDADRHCFSAHAHRRFDYLTRAATSVIQVCILPSGQVYVSGIVVFPCAAREAPGGYVIKLASGRHSTTAPIFFEALPSHWTFCFSVALVVTISNFAFRPFASIQTFLPSCRSRVSTSDQHCVTWQAAFLVSQ